MEDGQQRIRGNDRDEIGGAAEMSWVKETGRDDKHDENPVLTWVWRRQFFISW
jgi:hypothetical protein